jgi:hypothetical protein
MEGRNPGQNTKQSNEPKIITNIINQRTTTASKTYPIREPPMNPLSNDMVLYESEAKNKGVKRGSFDWFYKLNWESVSSIVLFWLCVFVM